MTSKISRRKLSFSRKFTFACIVIIAGLIILEILLRLGGLFPTTLLFEKKSSSSSWQENLFSGFMGIHQSDPVLLWKMKPYLIKTFVKTNSRGLTGETVPYEKDPSKFRILLLGDSTPLGIGLADWNKSFIWKLQRYLFFSTQKEIDVINSSTAGYTSLQGLKFLEEEGLKYNPDLVLVYLGNNDASYNGYLSDSVLMEQASQYIGIKKNLNKFAVYRMLKGLLIPLKSKLNDNQTAELQVRVSPESFRSNLEKIVRLCDSNGAKLIFNTIPVPLTWPPGVEFKVFTGGRDTISGELFMPEVQRSMLSEKASLAFDSEFFRSNYNKIDDWSLNVLKSAYTDTGDVSVNISRYQSLIENEGHSSQYLNNLGVLFWQQNELDSAKYYLSKALADDAVDPIYLYNMGMTYLKMGMIDSSELYLRTARDKDYNSLRIKSEYNNIIRDISAEHNLALVDLEVVFENTGRDHLFVDHCHPNQIGHQIIAEHLMNEIVSIMK
jgi:lysophospholipase L1-like esterase